MGNQQSALDPINQLGSFIHNIGSFFKLPPNNAPTRTFLQGPSPKAIARPHPTLVPSSNTDEDQFPPAIGSGWDGDKPKIGKGLEVEGLERITEPSFTSKNIETDDIKEITNQPTFTDNFEIDGIEQLPEHKVPETKPHITTEGKRRNGFEKKNESGKHDGGTGYILFY